MTAPVEGITGRVILPADAYRRSPDRWVDAHRTGIGQFEAAAVLGLDPARTPLAVWMGKVGLSLGEVGEVAEWRTALAAIVARKVGARHRDIGTVTSTPGLLAHPDHGWMLATPDRLITDRDTGRVTGLLEIVTTSERGFRQEWVAGPPDRVRVQVQQQLAVTGLEVAYVAVLVGYQHMPAPYRVERDEVTIDAITTYIATWWKTYVVGQTMPGLSLADTDKTARLWPVDSDAGPILATGPIRDLVCQLAAASRNQKRWANAAAEAQLAVEMVMRDRTSIVAADGRTLVTWRPQVTRHVDLDELRQAHPDLVAAHTKVTVSRPFRITAKREETDDC